MKIEKANINDLISPSYNPRDITSEEMEKLKTSIEEFGYVDPIIVNDVNMHIVGGNQRYEAMKQLGYEEVEVSYVHIKDLNREKALNIRLNNASGVWDTVKLDEILEELKIEHFDISLTGFDLDEVLIDLNNNDYKITGETTYTEYKENNDNDKNNVDLTENNVEEPPVIIEDEYSEDLENPTNIKNGDLFKLGNHFLLCGDSTNKNDLDKLLSASGERAVIDLVFTDPPYGMKKEKDGVLNDNLNYNDLLLFNKKWIPLSFKALKSNGSWYCWGTDEPLMDIYSNILKPMIKNKEITFRNLITWDKGHGQGQLSPEFRMYPIADEKCLFVMAGVQGFNNNSDNYYEGWEPIRQYLLQSRQAMGWDVPTMKKIVGHSELSRDHWTSKSQFSLIPEYAYLKLQEEAERQRRNNKIEDNDAFKKEYDAIKKEYDAIKKEYDAIKKEYYQTRAYFNNTHDNMNNIWHFPRAKYTDDQVPHSTPKPIQLCSRAIISSTRKNEKILDLFGGSGSTLIACEQTQRKCYIMELAPYYCQVIINRYEDFTGEKAIKIN